MHRCYQVDPRNRCSPFVAEEDLSLAWVRWRFPWLSPVPTPSHSASRHPTPRLGRDSLSFFDSRQEILAASSGMLATPGLFWPDQSLPAASTPAPGPHTSGWKIDLSNFAATSALSRLLRGLFSSRSTSLGNRHRAWTYNGSVSASRHPGRTYEPLDVIISLSTSRDSDSQVWSQPLRHSG